MTTESRALRQRVRNNYVQKTENVLDERELVSEWLPIIKALGSPNKYSGEELVRKLGKFGALKLAMLAVNGKEKTQAFCARELAHMGGLKPIERSASINFNVMSEAEVDSLLESKLEELGLELGTVKSGTEKGTT